MRRRTPREKKRLSYLKDGRNNYGENDKSSRRNIRRNKRIPNAANRRLENTALSSFTGGSTDVDADAIERHLTAKPPKTWKKFPDAQLGLIVLGTLEHRVLSGMEDGTRAAERIRRVRQCLGRPS